MTPLKPSTVYAAGGGSLYKSTNSGASWQAVNAGLSGLAITTLVIDPLNPATLYAGGEGVFKSTDSGASWQVVNSGLPPNLGVNVLAIDPLDGATRYAGTNGHSVFKITFKTLGDIDQDGDIDRSDLARITAALNQPANGPDDLRDLNGDLSIDALDARKLVLLCAQPQCATPRPNR
ncbi:MAG: WD40/YVTN/BNR-like repeat-containing protein [Methylobacter sp.]